MVEKNIEYEPVGDMKKAWGYEPTVLLKGVWIPREERLLLYLEDVIVNSKDNCCIAGFKVNIEEVAWLQEWNKLGFITCDAPLSMVMSTKLVPVTLSEYAWKLAHKFRMERGKRNLLKRDGTIVGG